MALAVTHVILTIVILDLFRHYVFKKSKFPRYWLVIGGIAGLFPDIDIPLGEVRVSENRGSAGHKGIDSIIQALGTKNFIRIRIGIQPTRGKPQNVDGFVLKSFQRTELPLLKSVIQEATESFVSLAKPRKN